MKKEKEERKKGHKGLGSSGNDEAKIEIVQTDVLKPPKGPNLNYEGSSRSIAGKRVCTNVEKQVFLS